MRRKAGCPGGGIGRRAALKMLFPQEVPVRFRPRAQKRTVHPRETCPWVCFLPPAAARDARKHGQRARRRAPHAQLVPARQKSHPATQYFLLSPVMCSVMETATIILAGGSGTRYGGKKQFALLDGKPLWRHLYDLVADVAPDDRIVVVGVDVEGGTTRNRSVQHGMARLGSTQRVMIFDAARPLVTRGQVARLRAVDTPSATFAMPVVDTLVRTDGTPADRSEYMRVQTPQAFDFDMLWRAVRDDRYAQATDETRVMFDEYGIRPLLLQGGENLMKVTYPEDMVVLQGILARAKGTIEP